jgi:hypothetical protein
MRPCVNIHQARRIDIRIALRRREALMSQKLLNGPQISASGQQMRRETMA